MVEHATCESRAGQSGSKATAVHAEQPGAPMETSEAGGASSARMSSSASTARALSLPPTLAQTSDTCPQEHHARHMHCAYPSMPARMQHGKQADASDTCPQEHHARHMHCAYPSMPARMQHGKRPDTSDTCPHSTTHVACTAGTQSMCS
jgi:hypothetical protein